MFLRRVFNDFEIDATEFDGLLYRGRARLIWFAVSHPGGLAVLLLRVQEALPKGWQKKCVRQLCSVLTGADFVPGCTVGRGLRLEHPNGVVIGKGSVVGLNCTMLQQVTLGEVGGTRNGYPTVGDRVFIGAGARLLGEVRIGDDVRIGAGAVVLSDIPDGATAVGVPARVSCQRGGGSR